MLEPSEPDARDSREAALRTAERLLLELKPRPVTEERNIYRLLCCFLALARRDKQAAENALQELTLLAG
jgi:tetratricopeptide repeat protein 21B